MIQMRDSIINLLIKRICNPSGCVIIRHTNANSLSVSLRFHVNSIYVSLFTKSRKNYLWKRTAQNAIVSKILHRKCVINGNDPYVYGAHRVSLKIFVFLEHYFWYMRCCWNALNIHTHSVSSACAHLKIKFHSERSTWILKNKNWHRIGWATRVPYIIF